MHYFTKFVNRKRFMKKAALLLFFCAFISCSEESQELIKQYSRDWEADFGIDYRTTSHPFADNLYASSGTLLPDGTMAMQLVDTKNPVTRPVLLKIKPDGTVEKTLPLSETLLFNSFRKTSDGKLLYLSTNPSGSELKLTRINLAFELEEITIPKPSNFNLFFPYALGDDAVYFVQSNTAGGSEIARVDFTGKTIWQKTYDKPIPPGALRVSEQGDLFFRGYSHDSNMFEVNLISGKSGKLVWSKTISFDNWLGRAPVVTVNSTSPNLIFIYVFDLINKNVQYEIRRIADGAVIRSGLMNAPTDLEISFMYPLELCEDGGMLFAVQTNTLTLVKTDSKGNPGWTGSFNSGGVFVLEGERGELWVLQGTYVHKLSPQYRSE